MEAERGTDCGVASAGVEAKRGVDCREESAGVEAERGTDCREESASVEAERGVGCGEKINRLADKLCDKAGFAIDSLGDENVDPQKLRQLVQSVKDLKEIVKYDGTAEDVGRLEELIKGLSEL